MKLNLINKKYFNNNLNIIFFLFIILFSRLLPHPPNFTPIISIAILCPIFFKKDFVSIGVIILGMFVTDLFLGFYSSMTITYLTLIIIFYFNKVFFKIINFKRIILTSFLSSLIFFIITNFNVWLFGNLYSKNFEGLINCYIMAIPFFHNTLISTTLFSLLAYFGFQKYKKIISLKI